MRARRRASQDEVVSAAARRLRLSQLGVLAAVVLVVLVAAVLSGGRGRSGTGPAPGSAGARAVVGEVHALLDGIPQSANALGSPQAPVTLQYFGDLECSVCSQFTRGALPSIIQRWVRSGKLRIEYRSLETATREQSTFEAQQIAALAAGRQDRLWDFIELFYREQGDEGSGYATEPYLRALAEQVGGLQLARWMSDRRDSALLGQLQADAGAAAKVGFTATPSFLIGRSGGSLSSYEPSSLIEAGPFDREIERLLSG